MDLVNDYFVVKFELEEDLENGGLSFVMLLLILLEWLRGFEWYNIEYEGLRDICYLCGRYGHKKKHCEKRNSVPAAVLEEGQSSVVEDVLGARRRSKAMHKDQGGRNNGVRTKSSRFDALHGVSENFGQDELVVNGVAGKVFMGKAVKPGVQAALNDISNMPQQDKKQLTNTIPKEGASKSTGFGDLIARGKIVIGGKRVESSHSLPDKVANWVSSKDVRSGRGFI
ncbi:unnamed protein product [Prunus armeniaca]